jgi:hypothetical protein
VVPQRLLVSSSVALPEMRLLVTAAGAIAAMIAVIAVATAMMIATTTEF